MRVSLLIVPVLLCLPNLRLSAQLLPDRSVVFSPLADSAPAGTEVLNGASLHAEFARTLRGDSDHRWSARIGGGANVVRVDSTFSLDLVGMTEIAVDPNNDITFNPRAIFWEEGLAATFRGGDRFALQLGFTHRCKHDIDNLEVDQQRTLIYSSLYGRGILDHFPVGSRFRLRTALRLDGYLYKLDSRSPATISGPDIEHLQASAGVTFRLDWHPGTSPLGIALTASGTGGLFGGEGTLLLGSTAALDLAAVYDRPERGNGALFLRWEGHRDAGIGVVPLPASLLWLGVRVGVSEVMW